MLTDKQIRDAKPKNTVYRLRDTNSVVRGFGVTVAPSGAKSFFLAFTSPEDGKRKQISLGRYPSVKLADARRLALEYRGRIDNGVDLASENWLAEGHAGCSIADPQIGIDGCNAAPRIQQYRVHIQLGKLLAGILGKSGDFGDGAGQGRNLILLQAQFTG